MILRDAFLNKIRELGYTLKQETRQVHIFRKKGGTHYITVHKTDRLEHEFVRSSLSQAGVKQQEVENFIKTHDC